MQKACLLLEYRLVLCQAAFKAGLEELCSDAMGCVETSSRVFTCWALAVPVVEALRGIQEFHLIMASIFILDADF